MDFLITISKPTGFWFNIIFAFEDWLTDYVLAIILITVLIKLVLLPFDVTNKYTSKKNARVQQKIKPELDKIKRQYASNPQMENQKTMELYKREGYSVVGTCVGMLVFMGLTLAIFFTLLSSLNSIASWKIYNEYTQMRTIYNNEYNHVLETSELDEAEREALAINTAELAVINSYEDIKTGFLWIKNIWRPDTNTSIVLSYGEFVKMVGSEDKHQITSEEYERIVTKSFARAEAAEYSGWNGLFLLSIMSALLTFGSMKVTTLIDRWKAKRNNKEWQAGPEGSSIITYIMPVIMGVFTLFYNSAFGIYIVTGAIVGFVTGPIVNLIVDKIDGKLKKKIEMKTTASYSRKREM